MQASMLCVAVVVLAACDKDDGETLRPETSSANATNAANATSANATGQGGAATTTGTGGTGGSTGSGGSGGGVDEAAGFVTGSRLRARYYQGADGSKQFIGFWDNQLNTDCYVTRASDQSLRCVPVDWEQQATVMFVDSACTQAIAFVGQGCTAPPYAFMLSVQACATMTSYRAWPIIGPTSPPSTLYGLSGPTCYATGVPQNVSFFSLGAEVMPSQMVAMTEMVE